MKIKKIGWYLVISLATLFVISFLGGSGKAAQAQPKVYKFKLQTVEAAIDPVFKDVVNFCERVKALSNGQIEITPYSFAKIVPVMEMFDALRAGTVDIIYSYPGWWSGKVGPACEVEAALPYNFHTPIEGYTLFHNKDVVGKPWAGILRDKVYKRAGVHYLGPIFGSYATIVSKRPLDKLDDYKGMKIAESGAEAKFFEMLGAKTVVSKAGDLYTPLASGVFEAIGYGGIDKMFGTYKLMEVAKYYQWPPTCTVTISLLMNMDKWNALPDNLKRLLEDVTRILYFDLAVTVTNKNTEWMRISEKDYGVKKTGLPMAQRWPVAKELREMYAAKDPIAKEMIDIELAYLKSLGYIE